MLRDGRVATASGYNGRFFHAARDEDASISIVWDGRLVGYDVWAIPKIVGDRQAAETFLRFAAAPEQMARLAELIAYGPACRCVTISPMPIIMARASWSATAAGTRTPRSLRMRRFEDWLERDDDQLKAR